MSVNIVPVSDAPLMLSCVDEGERGEVSDV